MRFIGVAIARGSQLCAREDRRRPKMLDEIMKRSILAVILGCCCAGAYGRKPVPIQTAKVVSQEIGSYNAGAAVIPIGTMLAGVPITRVSDVVVVETAQYRLTWQEQMTRRGPVVLPVNGTVQFYQDGRFFIVLDAAHKKHKFAVLHMEAIQ